MSLIKAVKLIVLFLVFSHTLLAQNIRGILTDFDTGKPVPYAQLLNKRIHSQAVSDIEGMFEISASIGDTIHFSSVGYCADYVVVSRISYLNIKIRSLAYKLNQVDVYGREELPQIYKSDVSFNEKPMLLQKIISPISFLYYAFSKREKAKKKVRDMIAYEKKMAKVRAIYNKELLHKFTGWTGDELDDCYMFCNSRIELSDGDDEFSIKYKVLELIALYRKSKK